MARGKNLTASFFVGAGVVAALGWISGGLAIVICTVLAVVVAVLVIVVCKKKKTVPAEEITEGSAE